MGCERTQSSVISQSVGLGSGGSGARRRWADGGWAAGPPTRQRRSRPSIEAEARTDNSVSTTPTSTTRREPRRGCARLDSRSGSGRAEGRAAPRARAWRTIRKAGATLPPPSAPAALGPTGRIFARNRERKKQRKIAPGGGARRMHASFVLPPHARAATRRPAHTPRARRGGRGGERRGARREGGRRGRAEGEGARGQSARAGSGRPACSRAC